MKFKMTIPKNLFTQAEIEILEKDLGRWCLDAVCKNFPSWQDRVRSGVGISAGEIFPQTTDLTVPVHGVTVPGFQLTISQVSNQIGRNLRGLCRDLSDILFNEEFLRQKGTIIFVQLCLDQPPKLDDDGVSIGVDPQGRLLIEMKRSSDGYEFI